jgi:hypothetical protein
VLLRAANGLIGFAGRQAELAELRAWRDQLGGLQAGESGETNVKSAERPLEMLEERRIHDEEPRPAAGMAVEWCAGG